MKYNKGEWSEAYAFTKLIGDGQVFASDEDLNKISDKIYPILKVFKDEIERYYETNTDDGIVNVVDYNGEIIFYLKSSTFLDIAEESLELIKNGKGRTFEVPLLKDFLEDIGIYSFKSSSTKKEDMKMEIFDENINQPSKLTFTLKSHIGSKPTILNASHLTNFTYRVKGMSDEDFIYLNSITKENDDTWKITKFNKIFEEYENNNYEIEWIDEDDNILYQNLRLIDSNLPKILAFIIFYYHSHERSSSIEFLTEKLIEYNPLDLSDEEKRTFYKNNISKFIETVTFGMTPNIKWDGNYVVSGGLLTVKKDGEILCHHVFYDDISLKNYLFKNTKLEGGSTSRHEYAQLYKQNDDIFFKLNLQLRFK